MPDVQEKTIILTSSLAQSLVGAYSAFQNRQVPQDFPLSQQDLYGIFDVLIQQNPLWEIDATDPTKYEKVVTHLRNIADPQIRETAVVPSYFADIQKMDQAAEDRRASFEMVKRNVERDVERMRTIYSAKPIAQPSLEQEQQEAVSQAEQILREEKHIESIPESRAYRLRTPPDQEEQVKADAQGEPKHVDEIRKWVNDGRLARILHAVRQTQFPQEAIDPAINEVAKTVLEAQEKNLVLDESMIQEALDRSLPEGQKLNSSQLQEISDLVTPIIKETRPATDFFDIDQETARPSRPVIRSTEEEVALPESQSGQIRERQAAESRKAAREAESALYLIYFRKPIWQSWLGLGQKDDPVAQLENAFRLVEVRYPNYAKKNALELRVLKANMEALLPSGEKIEEAYLIPEENIKEELIRFKSLTGANIFRLQINTDTNNIGSTAQSTGQILPQGTSTVSQEAREKALSTSQNLLSQAAIKLRNLFVNPGLGWLRGALGVALGLGGIVMPIAAPFKLLMLFGGGSLGLAQLSHSPQAMSAAVIGAGRAVDGLQDFAKLLANFRFQPTKMAGWVLGLAIALPIALVLLTYNKITNDQSLFVQDQLTSSPTVTESRYMSVTKTVVPNQYSGSSFPFEAKFAITITAKESNLNDVLVTDTFSVFGRTSPPTPSMPSGVVFPKSIPAGKTETINFSVNLGQEYLDSIVTNNVTIKANIEGGPQNEIVNASVSLIIGSPPSGCFIFEGTWPEDKKAQVLGASAVISRFPSYSAGICKDSVWGSGVNVRYGGSPPGVTWGGQVDGKKTITLFDGAFDTSGGRSGCATYTVLHESGHVYQNKNDNIYQEFRKEVNPPSGEAYLTSYPEHLGREPSEDFPEAIAMYIKRITGDYSCSGVYGVSQMENVSPKHYNFMQKYIK